MEILMDRPLGNGGTVALQWIAPQILKIAVTDQYGCFVLDCNDGRDALDKFEHPYAHDTRTRTAYGSTFEYGDAVAIDLVTGKPV